MYYTFLLFFRENMQYIKCKNMADENPFASPDLTKCDIA